MQVGEFRSEMLLQLRSFDNWAYKDVLQNPLDYAKYEFADWYQLFKDWIEND